MSDDATCSYCLWQPAEIGEHCKRCHDILNKPLPKHPIKGSDINGIPLDPRHSWRIETEKQKK